MQKKYIKRPKYRLAGKFADPSINPYNTPSDPGKYGDAPATYDPLSSKFEEDYFPLVTSQEDDYAEPRARYKELKNLYKMHPDAGTKQLIWLFENSMMDILETPDGASMNSSNREIARLEKELTDLEKQTPQNNITTPIVNNTTNVTNQPQKFSPVSRVYQSLAQLNTPQYNPQTLQQNIQNQVNDVTGGTSHILDNTAPLIPNNTSQYKVQRGTPLNPEINQNNLSYLLPLNLGLSAISQRVANNRTRPNNNGLNSLAYSDGRTEKDLYGYQKGGLYNIDDFKPTYYQQPSESTNIVIKTPRKTESTAQFQNVKLKEKEIEQLGKTRALQKKIKKEHLQKQKEARKSIDVAGSKFTFPDGSQKTQDEMDWREKAYTAGLSLGVRSKTDEDNLKSFVDDYLNPFPTLLEGFATAPYVAKQTNSNLPYLTGIGLPLLTGTLAGLGASSTAQFANNLVNPLAGFGKNTINNLGNKYLPNQLRNLKNVNSNLNKVNNIKNLEDLQFAQTFANQYGYKLPNNFERISQSNILTDKTIRGMMNRHNTFVRGVSTNWDELGKRNPEILRHLEGKGFNLSTEQGTKDAAEYMATHIPIKTGYGRASLDKEVFQKGEDALYTSNSIPTAEGYTYGQGYIVKGKKQTNFSSPNRQDWITENNPSYMDEDAYREMNFFNHEAGNDIIKDVSAKNIHITPEEKLAEIKKRFSRDPNRLGLKEDLEKIDKYGSLLLKSKYDDKLLRAERSSLPTDTYNFLIEKEGDAKKLVTWLKTQPYQQKMREMNDLGESLRKYTWDEQIPIRDKIDILKQESNKMYNQSVQDYMKINHPDYEPINRYAHYLHIGTPGEKILEPVKSWKITPEIWKNKSRGHTNTYSKNLSALTTTGVLLGAGALQQKQLGGNINDNKGYLLSNLHNFTPKFNSNNKTIVKSSNIQGKGLFANKMINPDEFIGLAHKNGQPVGKIGNYHNHSENPNSESILFGNKRYIKPKRPLFKGEEITVDYRQQPELEQPDNFQKGGTKYKKTYTADYKEYSTKPPLVDTFKMLYDTRPGFFGGEATIGYPNPTYNQKILPVMSDTISGYNPKGLKLIVNQPNPRYLELLGKYQNGGTKSSYKDFLNFIGNPKLTQQDGVRAEYDPKDNSIIYDSPRDLPSEYAHAVQNANGVFGYSVPTNKKSIIFGNPEPQSIYGERYDFDNDAVMRDAGKLNELRRRNVPDNSGNSMNNAFVYQNSKGHYPDSYMYKLLEKNTYMAPGTTEYDAHQIWEPRIRKEFFNYQEGGFSEDNYLDDYLKEYSDTVNDSERISTEDVEKESAQQEFLKERKALRSQNKRNIINDILNLNFEEKLPSQTTGSWRESFKQVEDPNSKFNHGNGAYGSFGYRKSGHLQQAYKTSPEFEDLRKTYGDFNNFWNTYTKQGYGDFSNIVDNKYESWLKKETNNNIAVAGRYNLTGSKTTTKEDNGKNNMSTSGYIKKLTTPQFKATGKSGFSNASSWAISLGNDLGTIIPNLQVNSIYRSPEHNKSVGGGKNSFHLEGKALDIKPQDWRKLTPIQRQQILAKHNAEAIDEGDHIHIEPRSRYQTGGIYMADRADIYNLQNRKKKFKYL